MGRRSSRRPPRPSEQHRVGRRIRARELRVIDHEGEQRGIMTTADAMDLAASVGLQLVEVNPKATPPVCKIMDYGKFKYETAKREREAKKNQKTFELKEVKFRPKTHGHDFDFKVRHVKRFLSEGDKVKLVVQFRGREVTHPETGRAILDRVCQETIELSTVVQTASMEGNRMNMVIAPKRELVQALVQELAQQGKERAKAAAASRPPQLGKAIAETTDGKPTAAPATPSTSTPESENSGNSTEVPA